MKLEEAIRRLQAYIKWGKPNPNDTFHKSVQLGIEALKARKVWQDNEGFDPDEALPGETKD